MNDLADVNYEGRRVGVIFWDRERMRGVFEYDPKFIKDPVPLSPLKLPVRPGPHAFQNLHESFQGLPGMLADCLPDTYGNTLIDAWVYQQGRTPEDFSPVEKLCYMGTRGMGALEFSPSLRRDASKEQRIEIDKLVELAAQALQAKKGLKADQLDENALNEILSVGTSAGGARAKAVIGWNPATNEVSSGQAVLREGYEHWLLKFDGVSESFEGVKDPQGYGRIEYAYHLMAVAAGIEMMECKLFEEGGRAHFMTKRFDRTAGNQKVHYSSFFGIAHQQYSSPSDHQISYEDYFQVLSDLGLSSQDKWQAFRRMVFNILAKNCDDHTKNFGFLLDEDRNWKLSPAFDLSYAHNPLPGKWTSVQQLSIRGKRGNISMDDCLRLGEDCQVGTKPKLLKIITEVKETLSQWTKFANDAGVSDENIVKIGNVIKVNL